jgi:hypothetical protein
LPLTRAASRFQGNHPEDSNSAEALFMTVGSASFRLSAVS